MLGGIAEAEGMIEGVSDDEGAGRPTVILGSGFSRAVADAMPTMPELGELVLDELGLSSETLEPFGGNLEQWMSYLSVAQPWLDVADNHENRGMFARVSVAIYTCITRAESTVITDATPIWLQRLAWTWCDQEAQVFTFNYDTLLERAVSNLRRVTSLGDLYALPLSDRYAVGDGGGMWATPPPGGKLLTLYKLHGSTSWGFGGLDGPANDRIVQWDRDLRWMLPFDAEPVPPRRQWQYDDLVPLIIPPTLTKGPYFTNLALRAQWRRASEALRAACRLTVIGYSFPPADLVASQWLGTSFDGVRMDVVDRDSERPAQIRDALVHAREGDDLTGDSAIRDYVDRECGDHVAWRIWVDDDSIGARASLTVNGVDLLAGIDPSNPPWCTAEYEDAQRWIHTLVDAAGGDQSVVGPRGEFAALQEDRQVVLPPGKHLTI